MNRQPRLAPITVQRMTAALLRRVRPHEIEHWFVVLRPRSPSSEAVTQRLPRLN